MPISVDIESGDYTNTKAEVLAVLVTEGGFDKQRAFAHLDHALGGALAAHVTAQQWKGRVEDVLDVPTLGRLAARRIVLVGAGPKRGFDAARLRAAAAVAARAAVGATSLTLVPGDQTTDLRRVAEGVGLGAYTFTKYFTGDRIPKRQLEKVSVYVKSKSATAK